MKAWPPSRDKPASEIVAPGDDQGQKMGLDRSAKPTFVAMHVDSRLSVSPPEPVNAWMAFGIVSQAPRRRRCANCVFHIFVNRTAGGEWQSVYIDMPPLVEPEEESFDDDVE